MNTLNDWLAIISENALTKQFLLIGIISYFVGTFAYPIDCDFKWRSNGIDIDLLL